MAQLVAGMASSHAFALSGPDRWDASRERNRQTYAGRYGYLPPEQPQVALETDEDVRLRYSRIRDALDHLQCKLAELQPDALILVGDDQNETFTEANLPQVAIYLGDHFVASGRGSAEGKRHECVPGLAEGIFEEAVEAGIDMASVRSFPEDRLFAHAFGPVLDWVDPEARVPVVPIFVNAIHVPAPNPARCYYYGQAVRRGIEQHSGSERVVIYASGGLSHFTSGYPYRYYDGPFTYGAISVDFDRWLVEKMQAGEGHALEKLTNRDIIGNGEIELRSWITMLGAIGDVRPELLVYEPFYRGIMGMGVGCWDLTR